MTTTEAAAHLKNSFPGKKFYVQCMVWTQEDGKTDCPEFYICVYDAFGKDLNAMGYSRLSLTAAVEDAVDKKLSEAEAMFAGKESSALPTARIDRQENKRRSVDSLEGSGF